MGSDPQNQIDQLKPPRLFSSGLEFLAKVAMIATIAYAYLFLLGWRTLAQYYYAFNIDFSALDLQPSYIFPAFSYFPIFLLAYWLWVCIRDRHYNRHGAAASWQAVRMGKTEFPCTGLACLSFSRHNSGASICGGNFSGKASGERCPNVQPTCQIKVQERRSSALGRRTGPGE
jgi:hypothetical protein